MEYSSGLKKNKDFQKVYRYGNSKSNKYLVMYMKKNNTEENRIGISVSKKVGNSIVRHRLARLIREGYRLQERLFHNGFDVVIVVRVNAKDCTYHEIERAIYHLFQLHHLVKEELDENITH